MVGRILIKPYQIVIYSCVQAGCELQRWLCGVVCHDGCLEVVNVMFFFGLPCIWSWGGKYVITTVCALRLRMRQVLHSSSCWPGATGIGYTAGTACTVFWYGHTTVVYCTRLAEYNMAMQLLHVWCPTPSGWNKHALQQPLPGMAVLVPRALHCQCGRMRLVALEPVCVNSMQHVLCLLLGSARGFKYCAGHSTRPTCHMLYQVQARQCWCLLL